LSSFPALFNSRFRSLFDGYFSNATQNFISKVSGEQDEILQAHLIAQQSQDVLNQGIKQGHPTSIFGKYLFGRRFEI